MLAVLEHRGACRCPRAEIDAYLIEGADLLRRAEECTSRLHKAGACEGHRLMAATTLMAMERLQFRMTVYRDSLAAETALPPATAPAPVPDKRRWWPILTRRRGHRPAYP
ncbi:hypothetical protein [Methylobacterium durans]|uniref:Uncharacterized protein n=1 Tax=Methylobacterium durans TaxID=2202825 RepID=A0A2U8W965_9HYPH|nr:hypothetical protein [Methylobacterium durans]AWN42683.1 hypothetical protein DK389_21985 [Methylobacterium durans]